jgi:phosphatidylglycerophosphate synthase
MPPVQPNVANAITLVRALLVVCVAALLLRSYDGPAAVIAAVVILLDGVDGWVARRTGTVTAFGARFDMEVDAGLILVLSVAVAPTAGWWVLLIGAARYLLLVATVLVPWLGAPTPSRYWAKVVAVVQAVVLTIATAHVLPLVVGQAALAIALGMLTESFGHQVATLQRIHRRRAAHPVVRVAQLSGHR